MLRHNAGNKYLWGQYVDNEPDWINSTGIALRLFPAEINAQRSCIGVTSCRDRLLRQLNPLLFLLTIQIIYNDKKKKKKRNGLLCNLLYTPPSPHHHVSLSV